MTKNERNMRLPVVQIADTEVQQISYKGEPVVTFAMVDEIHQRADGTASRNFRDNRERFDEGRDFIELTADEIRRQSLHDVFPPRTAKGILLTERGYLKLVKPMQDDRAWEVQGEMIDCYFKVKHAALPPSTTVRLDKAREVRLTSTQAERFGRMMGLTGNALAVSVNQMTRALTGFDCMEAMGITYMSNPTNERMINPTEIGKAFNASPVKVNQMLCDGGFQRAARDHKGNRVYELTEKGREAGGRFEDTGKRHGSGTMVQQLRWPASIIRRLADISDGVAA